MKEQNRYLTSIEICQRYSEMKFKSEIPKISQNSKTKKGHKTMTEKLGICLILTLNKIKTSWSLKKPSAVSKWGRRWNEVKLTYMVEEAIWGFFIKPTKVKGHGPTTLNPYPSRHERGRWRPIWSHPKPPPKDPLPQTSTNQTNTQTTTKPTSKATQTPSNYWRAKPTIHDHGKWNGNP